MKKGLLLLVFLLSACGHQGDLHERFIASVQDGRSEEARQLAATLYDDEASALVREMEVGMLHYLNKEYYQALQNFDKANALAQQLYTKSISKSVAAQIVGEGVAPYAGEKYELSLLRFYLSLTHYRLSQQGFYEEYPLEDGKKKEKQNLDEAQKRLHYSAARAVIKDWDALLTTYTREAGDKETFKQDMLAKTYGAEMHSLFGSGGDKQIARQLYKDIARLLDSIYKQYPSLQGKNAEALKKFSQDQSQKLQSGATDNVKVIFKAGLIAPKKAKEHTFEIPLSLFLASGSGNNLASCIGWVLPGQRISYEMPAVEKPAPAKAYEAVVKKQDGTIAGRQKLVLTAPVSEVAYQEFKNKEAAIITEKTARLTTKYVAAAVAACALYDPNDFAKLLGARLFFAASAAAITASEYADVRYWGLLPDAVYQQSFKLKKGKYELEIFSGKKKVAQESFEIKDSQPILLDVTVPAADNITSN